MWRLKMTRDSKRVYLVLYEQGPLAKAQMIQVLGEEKFEMAWIGAQNSHGKNRVAVIHTAGQTYYGLTGRGIKQLRKWEGGPTR
jgi:hypothetical protein